MKKLSKGFSILTLSALVLVPVASYAQSHIDMAVEAKTSVTGEAHTNLDATTGTTTDVSVEVNINTAADSENGMDRARAESNTDTDASLMLNSEGVAVTSVAQINSESDLAIFSSNLEAQNENVTRAEVHSNQEDEFEVEVVYRHKGKFLGFIPMSLRSITVVEARANEEAKVHSRLPWWSFLVTGKNYAKADLESQIKNNITIKANSTTSASAQAKARVAEEVIMEITANANARAAAQASSR